MPLFGAPEEEVLERKFLTDEISPLLLLMSYDLFTTRLFVSTWFFFALINIIWLFDILYSHFFLIQSNLYPLLSSVFVTLSRRSIESFFRFRTLPRRRNEFQLSALPNFFGVFCFCSLYCLSRSRNLFSLRNAIYILSSTWSKIMKN